MLSDADCQLLKNELSNGKTYDPSKNNFEGNFFGYSFS